MSRPQIRLCGIGPEFQHQIWESQRVLRVGRMSSCEVSLEDTSISRCHAEILLTGQGWTVRDLGSTNGTFLNGIRVGQVQRKLQERDILQFGNVVILVTNLDEEISVGSETPMGNVQVQATARHTWQESIELMALDVTRHTRPGEHLVSLLRAGHFLSQATSFDEMLQMSLKDAVRLLNARRGVILLPGDMSGRLEVRARHSVDHESDSAPWHSGTLAVRCMQRQESVLCSDFQLDPDLANAPSVVQGKMSSMICAALRSPRKCLGVLHLDRGQEQAAFTQDDLHLADALAAGMSANVANAQLMHEKQRNVFIQTVIALMQTLELRDDYTSGHNQRVTDYALLLAQELSLSAAERFCLQIAGPLHDIGKIGVDDAVLRKTTSLTSAEYADVKEHSVKGAALLGTIPDLTAVAPIVRSHHERWDGGGYPDGLAGTNIPHLSRIIAVADAMDVLTATSPYRDAGPVKDALAQIREGSGVQFDPECADACLRLEPRFVELLRPRGTRQENKKTLHELLNVN